MIKLIFVAVLIFFMLWLSVNINRSYRKDRQTKEAFLDRETQANATRKQSLDELDYITIPLDKLPFCNENNNDFSEYEDKIKLLSSKNIVNFTGKSNTDLKLEYGAANLNLLSEYDRNYTELVRTLYLWGKVLYDNNKISEAKQVLEYAVSINCDISQIYFILADIYVECHETGSIYNLIKKANGLNSLLKNSIVNKLNEILAQSGHAPE